MNARREPLLWLQLIALGVLPLELLLILLVLAGSDPGPLPLLERLLCWGLGTVLPALVLWRYPADPLSLLLLQVPEGLRSVEQKKLSSAPATLVERLYLAAGSGLLLPMLWWLDRQSSLASELAPLGSGHRLLSLVLSAALLAVLLWQWQQLGQATALLMRPAKSAAPPSADAAETRTAAEAGAPANKATTTSAGNAAAPTRLSLGLPLLTLAPLTMVPLAMAVAPVAPSPTSGSAATRAPVAVQPEQPSAEKQGE